MFTEYYVTDFFWVKDRTGQDTASFPHPEPHNKKLQPHAEAKQARERESV